MPPRAAPRRCRRTSWNGWACRWCAQDTAIAREARQKIRLQDAELESRQRLWRLCLPFLPSLALLLEERRIAARIGLDRGMILIMNCYLQVLLEPVAGTAAAVAALVERGGVLGGAALAGLGLVALQRTMLDGPRRLACPVLALLSVAAVVVVFIRQGRVRDRTGAHWPGKSRAAIPTLTAGFSPPSNRNLKGAGNCSFMQERLVREVLAQNQRSDWAGFVPGSRLRGRRRAWLALTVLAGTLSGLRSTGGRHLLARNPDLDFRDHGVTGRHALERGESLVVLARFGRALPANVGPRLSARRPEPPAYPAAQESAPILFSAAPFPTWRATSSITSSTGAAAPATSRLPCSIIRAWSAPMRMSPFPTTPGSRPSTSKTRVGSARWRARRLDLAVQFNKPVASARLIAKGKERSVLALAPGTNGAIAVLSNSR